MNHKIKLTRCLFYFSLFFLFLIYLLPGEILEFQKNSEEKTLAGGSIKHFFFFTYLTIVGLVSYIDKNFFIKTSIFLLILSILIEFLHLYVPYREFSLFDILANASGFVLGFFIITLTKKYIKKWYE